MSWIRCVRDSTADLTTTEYAILMTLASYADRDGNCYATQEQLAQITRATSRSIRRCLTSLKQRGILTSNNGRGKKRTVFTLHAEPLIPETGSAITTPIQDTVSCLEPSIQDTVSAKTGHDVLYKEPTPNIEIRKIRKEGVNPPTPLNGNGHGGGDAGFEEFWKLYPKHTHKHPARQLWITLSAEDRAAALAALPTWKRYFEGEFYRSEYKYVANPLSWLENRRWEDDPPPAAELPRQAVADWKHGAGWTNPDGSTRQFYDP